MQVLVLDDSLTTQSAILAVLLDKGFQVYCTSSVDKAMAYVRQGAVDLLVMRHRINGRGSLSVALAAEYHNPEVATILLSDMAGGDADELFDLLPSMNCLLGVRTPPPLIAQCAVAVLGVPARRPAPVQTAERPVFISHRAPPQRLMTAFREAARVGM